MVKIYLWPNINESITTFQPIYSPDNLRHELLWCGRVSWDGSSSKLSLMPNAAFDSGFFASSQILGSNFVAKELVTAKRGLIGVDKNGLLFRVPYDGSNEVI